MMQFENALQADASLILNNGNECLRKPISMDEEHISNQVKMSIQPEIFGGEFVREVEEVQKHLELTRSLIKRVVGGAHGNLLLQGPPGLGKSHVVYEILAQAGKQEVKDYYVVKGHITPVKLFVLMYLMRRDGQVLVLDDCDEVLRSELGLNIIKAGLDQENRTVSYQSTRTPVINGEEVREFEFKGTLIICTNISLSTSNRGRAGEHISAVLSRAIKWPLHWDSRIKKFAQIYNMVVNVNYLNDKERTTVNDKQKNDLLTFIWDNLSDIDSLDLRLPLKIAEEMKTNDDWRETCSVFIGV